MNWAAETNRNKMAAWKGSLWVRPRLGLPLLLLLLLTMAGGLGTASAEVFYSVLGGTVSSTRPVHWPSPCTPTLRKRSCGMSERLQAVFNLSVCGWQNWFKLDQTGMWICMFTSTFPMWWARGFPSWLTESAAVCWTETRTTHVRDVQIHLTLVKSFWSDIMAFAQSFITPSWTFYLKADGGKIVILQSKPEIQCTPHLEQTPTNLKNIITKQNFLRITKEKFTSTQELSWRCRKWSLFKMPLF